MFNLFNLTKKQLIYCCLVSCLDDWHHESFCEFLLVREHPEVSRLWGNEDSESGEAARLDLEEINILQEGLKELSEEDKWNFSQGIRHLAATTFY